MSNSTAGTCFRLADTLAENIEQNKNFRARFCSNTAEVQAFETRRRPPEDALHFKGPGALLLDRRKRRRAIGHTQAELAKSSDLS